MKYYTEVDASDIVEEETGGGERDGRTDRQTDRDRERHRQIYIHREYSKRESVQNMSNNKTK